MRHRTLQGGRLTLGKKRTIRTDDGNEIEATIMTFQEGGEHWNEYIVDDGTLVRIKLVTTEILRLDGQYDPEGNPIYIINSKNVVHVNVPEDMKRGGAGP